MVRPLDEWFDVVDAEVVGDFTLRITFDDNTVREIDFEKVLYGPVFDPLRDPENFRRVYVNKDTGTIEWFTGADFNPVVLHDWPEYVDAIIEDTKRFIPVEATT